MATHRVGREFSSLSPISNWRERSALSMTLHLCTWKIASFFLFCSLAFVTASGQSTGSDAASGIQILQIKWEKQNRVPGNFDPSVIPTGIALSQPETQTIRPGTTAAVQAQRDIAIATAHPSAQETGVFGNTPGRLSVFYVYSMKLKNVGSKAIDGVAWDYIFLDPATNAQVSRRQLLSVAKISPDKTANIEALLPFRALVTASAENQKDQKFVERAVVQCVLYSDQSMWKNEQAPQAACDFLKKAKEAAKHPPSRN
jgi:hypothetical protein